jgi:hypothetical protein
VDSDLEQAQSELARLGAEAPVSVLPPLEQVLAEAGGWRRALREADIAAQREVLGALIERVSPERIGRGRYRVEITWTARGEALRAAARRAAAALLREPA